MRVFRENLIEHEEYKGFYQHPWCKHLWVNKNGKIFNEDFNNFHSFKEGTGNYKRINNIPRHRIVVETFLVPPPHIPKEKLIVNHINGVPGDDWLDNLEWTDYSGNSTHAYQNGLRSDNLVVLCKDLRSGEVKEFYSMSECGRYFNVTSGMIFWHLKESNKGRLCFGYYLLIRKGDDWPDVGSELIGTHRNGSVRNVILFDKKNSKCFIAESVGAAAEICGCQGSALSGRLRRAQSSNLNGWEDDQWLISFLDRFKGEIPDDPEKIKSKIRFLKPICRSRHLPITVTNTLSGETKEYISSLHLAKELGIKKNTLQKHIYTNGGVYKGYLKIAYKRT